MADDETPEPPPPEAPKPPRFLGWLAKRPYKVLALLCLLLWLPGILSLPALDRDESRFAESSRQMLESGNLIDIRFGHVPRYKKPVGIYWAQAAASFAVEVATGDDSHIWTYRLPSLLGGIVAVWLTFWVASFFGAEAGLVAALLLAGSILLTAEASMATTDAVQLACILGMQGVLLRLYQASRPGEDGQATEISTRLALWGWAALALGILVKGPVTPAVAAVTILALGAWDWIGEGGPKNLLRRFRRQNEEQAEESPKPRGQAFAWLKGARPVKGVALALALVLPWVIAIAIQTHGDFFRQSLGDDFAAKVAGGQEGHGAPPGYYLIVGALAFWPAILFILPGVGLGLSRRGEPGPRFLLAWAGASWLMMEAVPTKLPNYILPAFPPLAILAALWLLVPKAPPPAAPSILMPTAEDGTPLPPPTPKFDWGRLLRRIAAVQFAVGLAVLAAAAALLRLFGDGDVPWIDAIAGVAAVAGLVALILFCIGRRLSVLAWALAASVLLTPLITSLIAPRLTQLWVSARLAALVAKDRDLNDPPPVLAGYEEPSLVFALGADTALSDGKGAAEISARQGGLALVDDAERPKFLARLAELQADATALDDLSGFNYSRGRRVHVTLYRVTALDQNGRPHPQ